MSTPSDSAVARRPEKSSFTQTCNLLSQYLKEKRGLGITPRIEPKDEFPTARSPAIMNLLTNMDNSEEKVASGEAVGIFPPPSASQMTIFYGGKVLVFNDLPSERAKEIMAMAGKGIVSFSRSSAAVSDKVTEPADAGEQPQIQTKVSDDLPIARRASLHRFFEKRKDRVAARAPYQVNSQHYSASSRPAAGESYRFNNGGHGKGNQQTSNHFDLNL